MVQMKTNALNSPISCAYLCCSIACCSSLFLLVVTSGVISMKSLLLHNSLQEKIVRGSQHSTMYRATLTNFFLPNYRRIFVYLFVSKKRYFISISELWKNCKNFLPNLNNSIFSGHELVCQSHVLSVMIHFRLQFSIFINICITT